MMMMMSEDLVKVELHEGEEDYSIPQIKITSNKKSKKTKRENSAIWCEEGIVNIRPEFETNTESTNDVETLENYEENTVSKSHEDEESLLEVEPVKKSANRRRRNRNLDPNLRFACGICGKEFHNKDRRYHHVAYVHGERKYPCSICGKSFKRSNNLKNHVDQVHLLQDKSPCNVCGKVFSNRSALFNHNKEIHEGDEIERTKCEKCGKEFKRKGHLKRHLMENVKDCRTKIKRK